MERHRAGREGERAAVGAGIGCIFVEGEVVSVGERRADGRSDGVEAERIDALWRQVPLGVGNLNLLRVRVDLQLTKSDVIDAELVVAAGVEADGLCASCERCESDGRPPMVAPVGSARHELQLPAVVEPSLPGIYSLTCPVRTDGCAYDVERGLRSRREHQQQGGEEERNVSFHNI